MHKTPQLLDWMLGPEHHVLFRRQQLKALVDIHGEDKGMGGKLSPDETKVITGVRFGGWRVKVRGPVDRALAGVCGAGKEGQLDV